MHDAQYDCVVLTDEMPEPDSVLLANLRDRGWRIVRSIDPYDALAKLALRERSLRDRSAWGLLRDAELNLVIARQWQDEVELRSLIAAARQYLPTVMIHAFEDGSLQSLGCGQRPSATPLSPAPDDRPASSRGRASAPSEDAGHKEAGASNGDSTEPERVTVTRDELDMLLEDRVEEKRT